jgi:hypothetical protein
MLDIMTTKVSLLASLACITTTYYGNKTTFPLSINPIAGVVGESLL